MCCQPFFGIGMFVLLCLIFAKFGTVHTVQASVLWSCLSKGHSSISLVVCQYAKTLS